MKKITFFIHRVIAMVAFSFVAIMIFGLPEWAGLIYGGIMSEIICMEIFDD